MNNNFNNSGRRPWNRQTRGGRGFGRYGQMPGNAHSLSNRRYFDQDRSGLNQQYGNHTKNKSREIPTKRLTEAEIGVTEYIGDHKGFNGIIKSRFSDFQVSEINEAGEVAKLTNMWPPKIPIEEAVDGDEDLLLNKYNLEILPMETWDKINKLVLSMEPGGENVEVDVTGMTKEHRTKIHEAVKKAFGDSIVGSTVAVDNKKFVKFVKYRKGIRIDNRVKWVWPDEYVYFVMYKENCDTMEAAACITNRLKMNIKPSMIGYAGTKDRRAKTSQWLSVRRVDPRRVAAASIPTLRLGNFRFASVPLRLGMLKGNRFRICLRNVTASDDVVEAAGKRLRECGFVNYYGLQRFGSRADVPTYMVGLKLLQGNFTDAIDCVLQMREGPMSEVLHAYWEDGAPAAARMMTPGLTRTHPVEARMLRALSMRPNDKLGAFAQVSRNSRLLYLHAYQSLVWNRVASERLKRSRNALPGDLVPAGPAPLTENVEDVSEEEDETDVDGVETEKEADTDNTKQDAKATPGTTEDKDAKPNKKKPKREPKELMLVKVLTQEDVDSGKYSISDIVLPLPGYNVKYPPNMKDFYEKMLAKDNLKLDMVHKHKSYSLSGGYRGLVVRPVGLSWRAVRYSDPHSDLILSDADELDGRTATGITEDGKYKALLITMDLPSSCYATMALRELLKVDTSSVNQAQQNDYHKDAPSTASGSSQVSSTDSKMDSTSSTATNTEVGDDKVNVSEKRKLESTEELDTKKTKSDT